MRRGIIATAVAAAVSIAGLSCDGEETTGPEPGRRIWEVKFSTSHGLSVAGVRDLWFPAADDGWACFGPKVHRYGGGKWALFHNFYPTYNTLILWAVCARGADDVWAGGTLDAWEGDDVLFHYDGGQWRAVDVPGLRAVYDLYFFAGGRGWVAGDGGLFSHDGASWTQELPGVFRTLSFASPTEGWACSGDALYQWDGTSWQALPLPTEEGLRGACLTGPSDGWAYTANDVFYYDGRTWEDTGFAGADIEAAHFTGPDAGWIVTRHATFRRYAPGRYESYEYPLTRGGDPYPSAVSVFVTDAGDAWAGSLDEWEMVGGEMYAFGYLYHAPAFN